jgi:peptidoglycan/LPS O-acetylase OafA/YrhL
MRIEHRRPGVESTPRMGYQPGLDGLRAVSVIVIMLYHAGFAWMHGGFFAVEVFFATSGFLITTLLLEERERHGRISLRHFWARRARRLLPALAALLATVAIVTLLAGTDDQLTTLRRDLPWSIFYAGNWGQILGDIPYWAADPPLLRHLWTLAIEEQFYLLWPLAFLMLIRTGRSARVLVGLATSPPGRAPEH